MNDFDSIVSNLYRNKKYKKLFSYIQSQASTPSSTYFAYLGLCYEKGFCINKDVFLATQLYIKACLAGQHKGSFASQLFETVYESTATLSKEERYRQIIHLATACAAKRDRAGELFWLEIALTYETASGYGHLGDYYLREKNPKCFSYLLTAYNKGLSGVAASLAYCYENGLGVDENDVEATAYYKLAAEEENAEAQFLYAERLFAGTGCVQDINNAKRWCRKASQNGNATASIALALCYDQVFQTIKYTDFEAFKLMPNNLNAQYMVAVLSYIGRFGVRDVFAAENTLKKLSDDGFAMAKYALGVIAFYDINICCEDRYKIYYDYILGASKDIPEANYILGKIFSQGLPPVIECNPTKAYKYFEKAAQVNCADAMIELGMRYLFGRYTSVDEEKALLWLKRSITVSVEPEACACIGIIYEKGLCGTIDKEVAEQWYSKAVVAADSYPDGERIMQGLINSLRTFHWTTDKREMRDKINALTQELKDKNDEINLLKKRIICIDEILGQIGSLKHTLESQNIATTNKLLQIEQDVANTNANIVSIGENLQNDISEINVRTRDMQNLLIHISNIQSEICSQKASFPINCDDETRYQEFIELTSARICQTLYQTGSACVEHEESLLKGMFGAYWDTLDPFSRKALVSARVFLANCSSASYGGLDYSGVCISACSALENELKLRFFTGYKSYLLNRFKTDYVNWPKSMIYDDRLPNERFTIGSMPAIFGSMQRDEKTGRRSYKPKMSITPEEKKLLDEYIRTILYDKNQDSRVFYTQDEYGLSFLDRCEDVRCIYRNTAAHTEAISFETATECCRDIIGIDGISAATKVGQIQGLIYDLVKWTKVP